MQKIVDEFKKDKRYVLTHVEENIVVFKKILEQLRKKFTWV